MSEEDAVREGAGEAAEAWLQEPAPVEEEVHRSVFASGLVQLLLGIAAAAVVGVTVLTSSVTRPLPGATRSAHLRIELRQAEGGGVAADEREAKASGALTVPGAESSR